MCGYSAILRLKIINNKSIEAIELSKIPCDIWERVALSEIIPAQISDGVMLCNSHKSVDLGARILGISDIYIGEWSNRYGYIFVFPRVGGRFPVKPYFFLIFWFSTVNIA